VIDATEVHPDIVYRIKRCDLVTMPYYYICGSKYTTSWFIRPLTSSIAGNLGCYASVRDAKASAARLKVTNYEIYKFHVGTPDSDLSYFMPTMVFKHG
jgi:hypothetical protein